MILLGGVDALSVAVADRLEELGFQVTRYGGLNRFGTAVAIASEGLGDPDTLIAADGADFPDALAAGAAAGIIDGAVVLTAEDTLSPESSAYLTSRPDTTRFAAGGPAAAAVPDATPLVGVTRIETAIAVAEQFAPDPAIVGIATSREFADALTGGAQVSRLGGPMLLSDPPALPATLQTYLEENADSIARAILYGGEAALAAAVETGVEAAIG